MKRGFEKLAVAMLLVVFVFALGNLVFNLENLNIGEENVPDFYNTGAAQTADVATSGTLSNALRWIYFGFLAFCIVVVAIGAISFASSKDRKKWRRLFIQLVGVLLAVGLIFALGFFYEDIESTVMGTGATDVLPDGSDVGTGNATASPDAPDTLRTVLTFGVFAVIILFCVVVLMAFNNFIRMRGTKLDYSDLERDKQAVAHTIQRTIDALAGGSDVRATVIRCYTDMCKVMAKHGVKEEEHLTPREFLKIALDKLPVPEEQMSALVGVFEEARYSKHALGEDDGKRAVKALEDVKERLLAAKPAAPAEPSKEAA